MKKECTAHLFTLRAVVDASRVDGEAVTAACTFRGRKSNISVSTEAWKFNNMEQKSSYMLC
jgi:hypothetical protein